MAGPTDLEQLLLELVNAARLDPMGDAARYISSYGATASLANPDIQNALTYFGVSGSALLSAFSGLVPVRPLVWNDTLGGTAQAHSAAMIGAAQQTHQAPGEPGLGPRVLAAGYNFTLLGENVYAYSKSALYAHAGFMVDWGGSAATFGMQSPAGHRVNLMNATYTEIGIDVTAYTPTGPTSLGPLVVTQDLGARGKLFVLGVAYADTDHNSFYSVGEGRADLAIQVTGGGAAMSTASGGFGLEIAAGLRTITLTGGGLASAVTVNTTIAAGNLKLDVVGGTVLNASGDVTVSGPITELHGLFAGGQALTAGSGAQTVYGNAGNDTIDGGTGADRLYGAGGDDICRVDHASDQVFEVLGQGTDTVISAAGFYLSQNIENLTLAAGVGDIFGVGNALGNALTGNAGANLLIAGAGDDVVHGGAGNDTLFGQDGADRLLGDAGIDILVGDAGSDTIDGGDGGDALYGGAGEDTLTGGADFVTDILNAGDGNDMLHGNSGLADYDLMDGGAGNDAYYVDTGNDLTFEALNGGTDTVIANIAGANNGVYLYAQVENLILAGTTTFGVGNELDNQLTGNAVTNLLLGGAGNDRLNGKGGNDVLFGQSGTDTFVFERGTGGDVIGDFAIGQDMIEIAGIYTSFAQLQSRFVQVGNNGAIDLGAGDIIVLHSVTMANLAAADFVLI